MDMDKIKIITPKEQTNEVFKICRKLWENNFDDSEEYTSFYFSDRWKQSITFLYEKQSMLHLNPYKMHLFDHFMTIYYIVGVCTQKESRHKGYMDGLLKKCLRFLYDINAPFVYLMPSDEKIYQPYDFTGIYQIKSFVCEYDVKYIQKNTEFSDIEIVSYDKLTDDQKSELAFYSNKMLSRECDCFSWRDKEYFSQKDAEMKACGSGIIVFVNKECIVGYAMHICEDMSEAVEFVADEKYRDKCIYKMFEYSYCCDIKRKEIRNCNEEKKVKIRFDESKFVDRRYVGEISEKETKNLLMARIIDIKRFIELLKTDMYEEFHVEISDDLISENNGKWDICLGEKSTIRRADYMSDWNENVYLKMSVSDFSDMMFSKIKFYLNEMV